MNFEKEISLLMLSIFVVEYSRSTIVLCRAQFGKPCIRQSPGELFAQFSEPVAGKTSVSCHPSRAHERHQPLTVPVPGHNQWTAATRLYRSCSTFPRLISVPGLPSYI